MRRGKLSRRIDFPVLKKILAVILGIDFFF